MLNSGLATVAATIKAIGLRVAAIVLLLVGSCLLIPRRADAQCTPNRQQLSEGRFTWMLLTSGLRPRSEGRSPG